MSEALVKTLKTIPVSQISVITGRNPRMDFGDIEALALSIKINGLQKPILVERTSKQSYILVDGERRLRAIKILNECGNDFNSVECFVVENGLNDMEVVLQMLISNDGKPFLPIEEASAFLKLKKEGLSPTVIGNHVGRSPTYVNDRLALVGASLELIDQMISGELPVSLAADIAKKSKGNPELEKELLDIAGKDKQEARRTIYGFRIPKKQKQLGCFVLSTLHNEDINLKDLNLSEEDRKSPIYLAAMLETLAILNEGSVQDVVDHCC